MPTPVYVILGGEKVVRNAGPLAALWDRDPREDDLSVTDGPDYPLDDLLARADARAEADHDRRVELGLPTVPPEAARCTAVCPDRNGAGTRLKTTRRCRKAVMAGTPFCNLHRHLLVPETKT